jgi:hypothetical protein
MIVTGRNALLNRLLHTLVQEWGYQEVESTLGQLSEEGGGDDARGPRTDAPGTRRKRTATKLPASEQVARAHLPEAQKAAMLALAMRFDQREFLPHLSDVREFLILMGERPGAMKDRSEGSCPTVWCRSDAPWRVGPPRQAAMAGRLTAGLSLNGAMVSRLM